MLRISLLTLLALVTTSSFASLEATELAKSIALNLPADFNFRQGRNQCGPYATSAAIRILTQKPVDPQIINRMTGFRINGGAGAGATLPWGLQQVLTRYGINSSIELCVGYSDQDKLSLLRKRLAEGKPIIMLNLTPTGYLHWFTVVGYKPGFFMVYDPNHRQGASKGQTADDNGSLPGNVNLSDATLLKLWSKGSYAGVKYLIISCWRI